MSKGRSIPIVLTAYPPSPSIHPFLVSLCRGAAGLWHDCAAGRLHLPGESLRPTHGFGLRFAVRLIMADLALVDLARPSAAHRVGKRHRPGTAGAPGVADGFTRSPPGAVAHRLDRRLCPDFLHPAQPAGYRPRPLGAARFRRHGHRPGPLPGRRRNPAVVPFLVGCERRGEPAGCLPLLGFAYLFYPSDGPGCPVHAAHAPGNLALASPASPDPGRPLGPDLPDRGALFPRHVPAGWDWL